MTRFCSYCGQAVDGQSKFCASCGNKVEVLERRDSGFINGLKHYIKWRIRVFCVTFVLAIIVGCIGAMILK